MWRRGSSCLNSKNKLCRMRLTSSTPLLALTRRATLISKIHSSKSTGSLKRRIMNSSNRESSLRYYNWILASLGKTCRKSLITKKNISNRVISGEKLPDNKTYFFKQNPPWQNLLNNNLRRTTFILLKRKYNTIHRLRKHLPIIIEASWKLTIYLLLRKQTRWLGFKTC